jgi:acyl-CoA dehydrogenase
MSEFNWIILALAVLLVGTYQRYSLTATVAGISAPLLFGALLGQVSVSTLVIWGVLAGTIVIPSVRQQLFTQKILRLYKKITPEMSETEQEAIDAGTVWWDGELFSGKPNWEQLHQYPTPSLTAEEQAFLDGPVEEVCLMVDEWQINHKDADLSPEIWQFLKDNKFFAMIIKKEYGGLDFSAYAQSRVLQKLSGVSGVLSTTVGVPNSLGPGELLQHYGTPEQQAHYLPRLAVGDEIPCFALTGPEAGSDAGSIPDRGIVCKGEWEGREVLGMRLTFDKRYITLAPVATVIGLAFKLYDPEKLLGEQEDIGITCALLPRSTPGLDIGNRHFPLNMPFQNGPIRGNDIFVPLDYIIGGADMAGKGWRMLMECLSVGRCITLPSCAAGGAKSIALATGAYARIRRQFKLPIGQMEGVEEMLARIGGHTYMMDAVTRMSTMGVDMGEKPSVISAICKYHLTENMRTIINDAMDVHGGKGIMLGPNNYLGRGYQGMPISITVEGANILTRNMMIFGQGAIRCHPFVLKEMQAAAITDTQTSLEQFDKAFFGHVGFVLSNFVGSLWFTLSRGYTHNSPHMDETRRYYQQLQGYSTNLAFLSDIAMSVLGGSLKRRERLSARLGDILSHLYLCSATLKRYHDDGRNKDELPMLHWTMSHALAEIDHAIAEFIRNFPNPVVKFMLKVVVQPMGALNKGANDKVEHAVATMLQQHNPTRTRLGDGQFTRQVDGNLLGDLERTLALVQQAEPLFDRICKALGEKRAFTQLDVLAERALQAEIISESEAQILRDTEVGRLRTINVDDFAPEELVVAGTQSKASSRKKSTPKKSVATRKKPDDEAA